jgi:hypothetical protein
MKKNSLSSTGLSLSQAQSISNLCNQRAREIENILSRVNNYKKTVKVDREEVETVNARPLPKDVVDLISEKSKLHAAQAFLMENIKAKDSMLTMAKLEKPDLSSVVFPETPEYKYPIELPMVKEEWGWEQLDLGEYNEYLEVEAFAAHIGQFIHEGKPLDILRKELPTLPAVEWFTIEDGKKSPVKIITHHTSEGLLKVHEELAAIHREHEQRVNYFKAKVKNLTTMENARIAKINSDEQNEAQKINNDLDANFNTETKKVNEAIKSLKAEFEKTRQASIKEIAALRINVDKRFQNTINHFLGQLPESQE